MANEHLCHCDHEQILHATNNECLVMGCPCSEGFQPRWMTISPKLKAALNERDRTARAKLQELNDAR